MKHKILWAIVCWSLLPGSLLFGYQQGSSSALHVEKEVRVGPGEIQENLVLLGGAASVEGLWARITVSGTVNGDIFSLGGRIELAPTALVRGDVVCIGGTLIKEPGCRIEGDTTYLRLSHLVPKFADGWKGFLKMTVLPFLLIFKLVMVFIWAAVTVVVVHVVPKRITFASEKMRTSFGAVLGTGALGFLIYLVLVGMAALLCLFLIGIPILLALLLAHFFITLFGRVVVYHYAGERLVQAFGGRSVTPLGASLLGLLAVGVLTFIPLVGLLVSLVVNFLVFGAALLTKFGTVENWFARPSGPNGAAGGRNP